jgi:hypothetical protein
MICFFAHGKAFPRHASPTSFLLTVIFLAPGRAIQAAKRRKEDEEAEARAKEAAEKKDKAERLRKFKFMLLEKGVSPGGAWEKELPKFCFDSRYKELLKDPAERKAAFESFSRADVVRYKEEARRAAADERAAALEAAKSALSQPGAVTANMSFEAWWEGCGRMIEGLEAHKGDKKLKAAFEAVAEPIRAAAEKAMAVRRAEEKAKFVEMLRTDQTVGPDSSWSKYRKHLERKFEQLEEAGKGEEKEEGEEEGKVGGVEGKAPAPLFDVSILGWGEVEAEFRSFVKGLGEERRKGKEETGGGGSKGDGGVDEYYLGERSGGGGSRRGDERKRRHDENGGGGRDDRVKRKRGAAVETYTEMLKEHVTDPRVQYEDARELLRKDERYEHCADELSSRERERLFDDHSDNLRAEGVKRLKEALEGLPDLTFLATFEEAWEAVSMLDARFEKMKARDREKAYNQWHTQKVDVEKASLKTALMDVPEAIMTMDEKNKGSIPEEVAALEQWKAMEGADDARSQV